MEATEVNRLLVIRNPISTHAERVQKKVINRLDNSPWAYQEIATASPHTRDNIDHVASSIQDGDVLMSCGGDGLANIVTNAVLLSETSDVRSIFLPFGNGNDISRSLNGRERTQNAVNILEHGHERAISPIEVIRNGDIRYALGYVGIGLTAKAANTLNQLSYRLKRNRSHLPGRLHDIQEVLPLLMRPNAFNYEDHTQSSRSAYELTYANGPLMGRLLKIDASFDEYTLKKIEISPTHTALAKTILDLIIKKPFHGIQGTPIVTDCVIPQDPTMIQLDGEPERLEPEVAVNIIKSRKILHTLSA